MDAKKGKGKQSQGKRLTDAEMLEIIKVIDENKKYGREIARDFGVTEGAIRKIKNEKESMKLRIQQSSDAARMNTKRATPQISRIRAVSFSVAHSK